MIEKTIENSIKVLLEKEPKNQGEKLEVLRSRIFLENSKEDLEVLLRKINSALRKDKKKIIENKSNDTEIFFTIKRK